MVTSPLLSSSPNHLFLRKIRDSSPESEVSLEVRVTRVARRGLVLFPLFFNPGMRRFETPSEQQTNALRERIFIELPKNPTCSLFYELLVQTLVPGYSIVFHNGAKLNKTDLCRAWIALDPHHPTPYKLLSHGLLRGESIRLYNGKSFSRAELIERSFSLDPKDPLLAMEIARLLPQGGSFLLANGTRISKRDLILHSIKLDPFYWSYFHLALTLEEGEVITLPDGKQMNDKELLLRTIELAPGYPDPYYYLAVKLGKKEKIRLHNGLEMSAFNLLFCAIRLDPDQSATCNALALLMGPEERIELTDGSELNRKQLLLRGLAFEWSAYPVADNLSATIRYNLANLLDKGETVTLPSGKQMDGPQLLLAAIALEPKMFLAYLALYYRTAENESVLLHDGSRLSRTELRERAFQTQLNFDLLEKIFNLTEEGEKHPFVMSTIIRKSREELLEIMRKLDPTFSE